MVELRVARVAGPPAVAQAAAAAASSRRLAGSRPAARVLDLVAVCAIAGGAWMAMLRVPHTHAAPFLVLVGLWSIMTAAMMLPAALPWVAVIGVLRPAHPRRDLTLFLIGYSIVWFAYCVGAAAVQRALDAWMTDRGGWSPLSVGVVVAMAGLYQLSPVKGACLRHCRSPLSYVLSRWSSGCRWAFDVGLAHGARCLGCCWALMAVGLVTGVTHVTSMVAITALVLAEQLTPWGGWMARAAGIALILLGVSMAWGM